MRRSPVEPVLTAVVVALKGSTGVTGLIGSSTGIYNNVEQGAAYPYLEVSSPTDRREDTCGRFGAEMLVDVKVVSQALGDQEASRVNDQVIRALNFTRPTLSEHVTLGLAWDSGERYKDVVNGIVTRYHVGTYRVWTEQSST